MSSRLTRPTVSSRQKAIPKKPYTGTGKPLHFPMQPKFDWRVNEEFGYFELGAPLPDDDYYIMHTTLVSCEYFHLLLEGGRDDKPSEGSFWTVQYPKFGCNILADPFELSNEKDSHRTFIGERATARIRCNAAVFHQYLTTTSVEFRIFRSKGAYGHPRVAGVSFVELKGLTKIDVKGLKATLEVIPHGDFGTRMSDFGMQKPELRILIELTAAPNFFAHAIDIPAEMAMVMSSSMSTHLKERVGNQHQEHEIDTQDDETQTRVESSAAASVSAPRQPITSDTAEQENEGDESESDEGMLDAGRVVVPEVTDYETSTSVADSRDEPEHTPVAKKNQRSEYSIRAAEAGDSLDGVGMSRKSDSAPPCVDNNLGHNKEKNFANLANDEMIRFQTQLREKERAYLQILAEEWTKRDEERESKTTEIIREHAILKEKLELKEYQLNEKENSFFRREREMEESTNRIAFDLTQRLEDSKIRQSRLKEQHRIDIDVFVGKVEKGEAEIRRLNVKIQTLEAKLSAKEDEIDRLNASRSQWPDMNLERRALQLEEKNVALKMELHQVRQQRDCYRSEAHALAHRQNKLQLQREAEMRNENEALRAQILMNQQRKDMREERESVREVSHKIEALKEAISKRDSQTREANLSGNSDKRVRSPPVEYVEGTSVQEHSSLAGARLNHSGYTQYLNPVPPSSMSQTEIDNEITRLVGERDRLLATGTYLRSDSVIRDIDNALTRLASDLMAGSRRNHDY